MSAALAFARLRFSRRRIVRVNVMKLIGGWLVAQRGGLALAFISHRCLLVYDDPCA